ncbi:acyl carrier protein [Streptacidiphilus sp. PAMC 29251]
MTVYQTPSAEPGSGAGAVDDPVALVALLNAELGLAWQPDMVRLPLEALPGWDSLLLLRLVGVLEETLRRPLPVAEFLSAASLEEIGILAAAT